MTSVLLQEENQEDISLYIKQIRLYPLLTAQQEQDLARLCALGDRDAICTMVSSNLRLVVAVAREYTGRGVALTDLIQEGNIGLLIAAEKFDPDKQTRFSTYATKWIRKCVTRAILNHAGLIRVPVHTAEAMKKILAVKTKLNQTLMREPTDAEIAQYCQISESKVKQLMALLPQVCSLDAPLGENEDSLGVLLKDTKACQPQEALLRRELKDTLDELLEKLDERQKHLLQLRFGMLDGICHSLDDIGKQLGISKERARQIEHQAMDKLRLFAGDAGLEDFLQ